MSDSIGAVVELIFLFATVGVLYLGIRAVLIFLGVSTLLLTLSSPIHQQAHDHPA